MNFFIHSNLAFIYFLLLSFTINTGITAASDNLRNDKDSASQTSSVQSGFQEVIYVDDNAPNDPGPFNPYISDPYEDGTRQHPFDTIQEGINAASNGHQVSVSPGVYTESIDFLGKTITVRSQGDAAVIRSPDDYAVSFYTAETTSSELRNFVIRDSSIGIFIANASPTIANVTVVKNDFGIVGYSAEGTKIRSSIFWLNTDGDLYGCQAKFSCIEENLPGEGNIYTDPCFADADNDDFHLRSTRGRYQPEYDTWVQDDVSSPCIDAGDPNVHSSGGERYPNGGRINMGSYGNSAYASMSEWNIFPDFNNNNIVDTADLAFLTDYWLSPPANGSDVFPDLTDDDFVNFADFAVFSDYWLEGFGG